MTRLMPKPKAPTVAEYETDVARRMNEAKELARKADELVSNLGTEAMRKLALERDSLMAEVGELEKRKESAVNSLEGREVIVSGRENAVSAREKGLSEGEKRLETGREALERERESLRAAQRQYDDVRKDLTRREKAVAGVEKSLILTSERVGNEVAAWNLKKTSEEAAIELEKSMLSAERNALSLERSELALRKAENEETLKVIASRQETLKLAFDEARRKNLL